MATSTCSMLTACFLPVPALVILKLVSFSPARALRADVWIGRGIAIAPLLPLARRLAGVLCGLMLVACTPVLHRPPQAAAPLPAAVRAEMEDLYTERLVDEVHLVRADLALRAEQDFKATFGLDRKRLSPPVGIASTIRVFYGTTRKRTGQRTASELYGREQIEWPEAMELGVATVSLPAFVPRKGIERPYEVFTVRLKDLLQSEMVLLDVQREDKEPFYANLRHALDEADHTAFVFVHGYDTTFADAVRKTAQLAAELRVPRVPILFSWASHGSVWRYVEDEEAAETAVVYLEAFLREIATRLGAARVHLIAQGMGNRVLLRALERLAQAFPRVRGASPFSEAALVTPDLDEEAFLHTVGAIKPLVHRVTMYLASTDPALRFAHAFVTARRAGEAVTPRLELAGMDIIDASAAVHDWLTHAYRRTDRSVLLDILHLLETGADPAHRCGLVPVGPPSRQSWRFDPDVASRCP